MGSAGETQITPIHVSDEEANLFAMQLASASVLPMILKSAVELDLLEIIAKAGSGAHLSPSDIASQLPTRNPDAAVMLDRMLRLLASYNILTYSIRTLADGKVERLYGLAPVAKYLVKNEDGVSLSSLCLMNQDKVFMESWYFIFCLSLSFLCFSNNPAVIQFIHLMLIKHISLHLCLFMLYDN